MIEIPSLKPQWAFVKVNTHDGPGPGEWLQGFTSEATIAGKQFVQIEVPDRHGNPLFTRFYPPEAIKAVLSANKENCIALSPDQPDEKDAA